MFLSLSNFSYLTVAVSRNLVNCLLKWYFWVPGAHYSKCVCDDQKCVALWLFIFSCVEHYHYPERRANDKACAVLLSPFILLLLLLLISHDSLLCNVASRAAVQSNEQSRKCFSGSVLAHIENMRTLYS